MPWVLRAGETSAWRTGRWPWIWLGWSTYWWRTRSIGSASALDRAALLFGRTRGHTPALERALALYSRAGEHGACWLSLGLSGAALTEDAGRRRRWLRGAYVVAGAYAINYLVKLAVGRPRPELPGIRPLTATGSRLAFPSAHATTSFAACRVFRGLLPTPALY